MRCVFRGIPLPSLGLPATYPILAPRAFWRKALAIGLLLLLSIAGGAASGKDVQAITLPGKRILILHSYFKGFKWTDDEHQGISSVLEPAVGAENLYVEYMDTKRFYWDSYLVQLSEVYRQKYGPYRPDLVLVTDNNAFDFMRRFGNRLFPGVPVVFCGVNYAREEDLRDHPNFAGVSEEGDLKTNLDLALRLAPGTRYIYAPNDSTETGQVVAERLMALAPAYPDVTFIRIEGHPMAEMLNRLQNLPPRSLIFFTFFSRDVSGQFFEYQRSMRLVADATAVPIFGAWDFNLGHGLVGGALTSGVENGEAAARIALRVLAGEKPADIPLQRNAPSKLRFDYDVLARHRIPLSSLPSGSEVINLPQSIFFRYRTVLLGSAGTVVFLVTVIAILIANISRRKRAEEDLLRYQDQLEEQVRERSAQLQTVNDKLQQDLVEREKAERALRTSQELLNKTFASLRDALLIVDASNRTVLDCNPATRDLFGYEREELIGRSTRCLHVDDASYERLELQALAAFEGKGFLYLATFRMTRKSGEAFDCELAMMPLYGESRRLTSWVAVIRDITEQRQTEAKLDLTRRKLRALTAELTLLEERERRGIAAQLHDQLGAVLAMGKVKLAALLRAHAGTPVAAPLEEIHGLVGEAVNETRSLTWELSPPILYQLGLSAAIEWLCEETENRSGFQVRFTQEGEPVRLSDELRFLLFSAVRELLLNVVKHAEARQVKVTLRWTELAVGIQVVDDGKGFDLAETESLRDARKSFGLFNIQERVADLDGEVEITSAPAAGTAVSLVLPFKGADAP